MLIYIVRHGLTEWNKLKKLQGAADVPLAKEGILLAEKTGEALRNVKFDICFTSPLSRAKQTAEYVLGNVMFRSYRISGSRRSILVCWRVIR